MSPKSAFRRKNITMACVPCRESKVKCDGVQPLCSNCETKSRQCSYKALDKRKIPLRVAIELLIRRVDQLCEFIDKNGLSPPSLPEGEDVTLSEILEASHLAKVNTVFDERSRSGDNIPSTYSNAPSFRMPNMKDFPAAVSAPEIVSLSTTSPNVSLELENGWGIQHQSPSSSSVALQDAPSLQTADLEHANGSSSGATPETTLTDWDMIFAPGSSAAPATKDLARVMETASQGDTLGVVEGEVGQANDQPENNSGSTLCEHPDTTADIEGLIDKLSDRVGTLRIGHGGKTHFFGPTSTFNLSDMPYDENSGWQCREVGPDPCNLDRIDVDRGVPPSLEEHLINLYFSWQDTSPEVVNRAVYEKAKSKRLSKVDTSFYSEALRNAMCAVGSAFETRFHPTYVTFPQSLVGFFGDCARSSLEKELDCPSVATVQAMIILSSHEIGNGVDSRGWLYSGMAIRLSFDLALHIDMSSHVRKGVISAADADQRRSVFWAAYVMDHQVGFHLGRPFRTNMEDVTVGKPSQTSNIKSHKWIPYENPRSFLDHLIEFDCTELVKQQLVSLCEIMAPCGYFLYTTSKIEKTSMQRFNEQVVSELFRWKANLPPALQVNLNDHTTPYSPHVILLHMQYHQNIIYSHRPWMSKSYLQPQPPKGPGFLHARQMCIESAIAIAMLIVIYETRYNLRRINVKAVSMTSSAVLMLLFAAVTKSQSCSQTQIAAHLSTCFRALDEFSLTWANAKRALKYLVTLQQQWGICKHSSKMIRCADVQLWQPNKRPRKSDESAPNIMRQDMLPRTTGDRRTDFHLASNLDWMLMADEDLMSETCDKDLLGWDPTSAILERENSLTK